jgi:integrase/recombinase XerC
MEALAIRDDSLAKAHGVFDLMDVSETTRADYKYRIGLFLEFVHGSGLNANSFLDFKRSLAERTDITTATKNKYLATAKVFLKELNRKGVIPVDITQNIKTFSQSKKHKRDGLNDEEMKSLIDRVRQLPDSPQNARLKAILCLLALQGLRQIEIIRLDVKDLDFVAMTAFIQGKGSDDKEPVSLHPETVKVLKDYISTNRIADGSLFQSNSNNSKNRRLTTRALRGIVKQTLHDLGIDKSTHGFRHYFTTKLIKAYKGDLLEVAQYTRHKSLEMLQVYNDSVKREGDLPRYYQTFNGVSF